MKEGLVNIALHLDVVPHENLHLVVIDSRGVDHEVIAVRLHPVLTGVVLVIIDSFLIDLFDALESFDLIDRTVIHDTLRSCHKVSINEEIDMLDLRCLGKNIVRAAAGNDAGFIGCDLADDLGLEAEKILRRYDVIRCIWLAEIRCQIVDDFIKNVMTRFFVGHTEILLTDGGTLRCELDDVIVIKMDAEVLCELLAYETSAGSILSPDGDYELLF